MWRIKRNLRTTDPTEADVLKTITDYLDLLQAQGNLLYIRHNPSTVISKSIRGKIKTAFKKVRPSQIGAVDLFVFRLDTIPTMEQFDHCDVLCIEVKSATGKMSPAQKRWAKLAVAQGMRYIVARSLEDVRAALK